MRTGQNVKYTHELGEMVEALWPLLAPCISDEDGCSVLAHELLALAPHGYVSFCYRHLWKNLDTGEVIPVWGWGDQRWPYPAGDAPWWRLVPYFDPLHTCDSLVASALARCRICGECNDSEELGRALWRVAFNKEEFDDHKHRIYACAACRRTMRQHLRKRGRYDANFSSALDLAAGLVHMANRQVYREKKKPGDKKERQVLEEKN